MCKVVPLFLKIYTMERDLYKQIKPAKTLELKLNTVKK